MSGRFTDKQYRRAQDISSREQTSTLLVSLGQYVQTYSLKTVRADPTIHSMLISSSDQDGIAKAVVDKACDIFDEARFLDDPAVCAALEEARRGGAETYVDALRKVKKAFLQAIEAAMEVALGEDVEQIVVHTADGAVEQSIPIKKASGE